MGIGKGWVVLVAEVGTETGANLKRSCVQCECAF